MKKFLKFLKENYKPILKGLFLACVLICGYEVLHNIATEQRGYNAIGGEIFVFFLPYLWWAIGTLKESGEENN